MLLQMALFHSSLWPSNIPCIYVWHPFFHFSVDGHLGCFHVLAIVNCASVNTGVHVLSDYVIFSGYMLRSGIAGSYGISIFSFLRKSHSILHSGYTLNADFICIFLITNELHNLFIYPLDHWFSIYPLPIFN